MNKGEIRAHFIALLNRSDCPNALADTFIDQAITRIQRQLRVPAMEKQNEYDVTSVTPVSKVTMPSDLLEVIEMYYDGLALVRIPLNEMVQYQRTNQAGAPRFYCREQSQLRLFPMPDSGSLYLNYYGEQDPLVNDTDTNMFTTIASDLLTYTALSYAADYFLDERGTIFDAKSSSFLLEIQEHSNSSEQSGINQAVRPNLYYED